MPPNTETVILFLVDPPYLPATRSKHNGRYRRELTEAQHVALRDQLCDANGLVVLAGYASPFTTGCCMAGIG